MKANLTVHPRLRMSFSPLVWALLALMGFAGLIALYRYAFGVGAISNLSNSYPWGFWVSFDLFTGIAISSGAFIIAAVIYIFELKEFKPMLRAVLLTALLGYIMEAMALMVELGHPERIWYFFIYQNWTSFLLFIGLYVMIYIAIMAAEFSPAVFERLHWEKSLNFMKRLMKPLVIVGVVISILHQGSLGALMLIQPAKLFPLWWTPLLPVLFFISAISIGLAMTIFESSLSSRYFKRGLEIHLLQKLAAAIPWVLGIYLMVKFGDLFYSGDARLLFNSSLMSILFWSEILLGVLFPMIWFSFKRNRQSPAGLFVGAVILLFGMIFNRFNVSWFAVKHANPLTYMPTFMGPATYTPSWTEFALSIGIFSFGILAFGLAVTYLPVFEPEEQGHSPVPAPETGD
jgi:Ni/Fe-hydrogenase subunit HybB-like protein